ncbi:MAG: SDR family NAD(P)-dependent oxidoreductase [archaeon]
MNGTAVVVGAGDGIGTTLFRRFAEAGMRTAICTNRADRTDPVADELRESGCSVRSVACDPADPIDIAEGFADVFEAFDTIDVVTFVVGEPNRAGLLELPRSDFLDGLDRDVLGGFCTARAVVPPMVNAGGGTLLFVGGPSSIDGKRGSIAASTSQAGLRGLAASISTDLDDELDSSFLAVDRDLESDPASDSLESVADRCVDLVRDDREYPLANEYRIAVEGSEAVVEQVESPFEA